MIRVHAAALLVLLELLLMSIGVGIYLYFWGRRQKVNNVIAASKVSAENKPDAGQYLLTEEKLTRSRHAIVTSATNLDDHAVAAGAALALRADYLQMEHELNALEERDDAFWQSFDARMRALLDVHAPQKTVTALEAVPLLPKSSEAKNEDAEQLKELVGAQVDTIKNLRWRLTEAIGDDLKRQELEKHIDHIEHTNKEMASCVSILEGENEFLRNQIAELLKQ
ncbi:MAG: hypothetical protein HY273_00030 [Gammaproteobacteria bacterium]|nr:hypothetical protein [Gammaproteobacteria bacterium]